jgi:hypothetical protein
MPNRTYEEMEKEVRDHFDGLTEEEFQENLKRSNFEFFNQVDDDVIHLGEPDVISKKALEKLKKCRNIKDLSHLISFEDDQE